jgi:hypothetical protein
MKCEGKNLSSFSFSANAFAHSFSVLSMVKNYFLIYAAK